MGDAQESDDTTAEASSASDSEEQSCPGCGRTVGGQYCPECGTAVGRSLSAGEVVGDFFRELVDVERGFWGTLKALSSRPGPALRTYLDGGHRSLMSPGRYLLAAVVICYGADQMLTWLGVRVSLVRQAPLTSADDTPAVVREVQQVAWRVFESQGARIAANLLLAGLLAAVLWRLFGDELQRGVEALALSGFLVGHTVLLEALVKGVYAPAVFVLTGEPAEQTYLLYMGVSFAYVGWALHGCFGQGWRGIGKGLLGLGWAFLDLASILAVAPLLYGLWLTQARPEAYPGPDGIALGFFLTAVGVGLPVLLHAGFEGYDRLR